MSKSKKEKGLIKAMEDKVLFISDELKKIARKYNKPDDEVFKVFIASLIYAAKMA